MYKLTFLVLFIIIISLTIFFYSREINVDWELFVYWRERVQNISEPESLMIMVVFVSLYIGSIILFLPFCGVLSILGGTLFGWTSFCLSMLSSLFGALIVFHFLYSRFNNDIRLLQNKKIKSIATFVKDSQFLWLIFLRLLPILPFSIVSALSAQFIKEYRVFLLGTFIGSTPGLIAHTLIGIQIKNIIMYDYDRIVSFNVLLPVIFLCLMSLTALYLTNENERKNQ